MPVRESAEHALSMTGIPARIGPVLLGRDSEIESVSTFLNDALLRGGSLVLCGEAGIGKTSMLIEAERLATERGAQVLKAVGLEFEADLSFGALLQVLGPVLPNFELLDRVQREVLLSALGLSSGSAGDRVVVAAAALQLLRRVAAGGCLLLAVDDLQWVDRSSASVFDFLAHRLAGSRIALIATSRLPAGHDVHRSVLAELAIGPIDELSASTLLDVRHPGIASSVRQRIVDAAEGNPMALLELPWTLTHAQRRGVASLPGVLPLPRRLQEVYEQRILELPESTQELLLLVALCGSENLRAIRGVVPVDRWLTDSEPAIAKGLASVDAGAGRLDLAHSLVASAVVGLASPSQCRNAHALLADCYPEDATRRAWHLAEAATGPDDTVADLLESVAQESLRRGDAPNAVGTMIKAANLSVSKSAASSRFAQAAYWGLHFSSEFRAGAETLAAAGAINPEEPASLYAAAATAFMLINDHGDVDSAHNLLVSALEAYRGDFSDDAVTRSLHTLVGICMTASRVELWRAAEPLLSRAALPPTHVIRLASLISADPIRHMPAEKQNLLRAIADLRTNPNEPELHALGAVAVYADCVDIWWVAVQEALATPSHLLSSEARSDLVFLSTQCHHEFLSGQWQQLRDRAAAGTETCLTAGNRWMAWTFAYRSAMVAAACGDDAGLARALDHIAAVGDPRRMRTLHWDALLARTLAAHGRRDFEEAYRCAVEVSPAGSLPPYVSIAHWLILDLVDAAVRTGRREEAIAHVAAVRDVGLAEMSPRMCLLATATEALVDTGGSASVLFRRALATPGADRTPFDFARVQLLFGEHLRREREVAEARLVLAAAAETFEQLGARPWIERANAELRASGLSAVRGSSHGPVTLTAQELEIAQLAASGLSNKDIAQRLFMSPRTVGSHLYRIFPKLSITSRAALRDALAAIESNVAQ